MGEYSKEKEQEEEGTKTGGWLTPSRKNKKQLLSEKQKITRVGKDVKKSGSLCTVDGGAQGCTRVQRPRKTVWKFLKKSSIELLYEPTIPRPGIYPHELKTGTSTDTGMPMFMAASFVPKGGNNPSTRQ